MAESNPIIEIAADVIGSYTVHISTHCASSLYDSITGHRHHSIQIAIHIVNGEVVHRYSAATCTMRRNNNRIRNLNRGQ